MSRILLLVLTYCFVAVNSSRAVNIEVNINTGNFQWTDSFSKWVGWSNRDINSGSLFICASNCLDIGISYGTWKTDLFRETINNNYIYQSMNYATWESFCFTFRLFPFSKLRVVPFMEIGLGEYNYRGTSIVYVDGVESHRSNDEGIWRLGVNSALGFEVKVYGRIKANVAVGYHYLPEYPEIAGERSLQSIFIGLSYVFHL